MSLLFIGIYGLKYFSQIAHAPKPKTATNPINSRKLTIFGGKGGVGEYAELFDMLAISGPYWMDFYELYMAAFDVIDFNSYCCALHLLVFHYLFYPFRI